MPIFILNSNEDHFPSPELADPSGILAVGGTLTPRRLLAAYRLGIFPWYSEGQPVLWHSPDPRFAFRPEELHVPRSLQKTLRKEIYEIRYDTCFEKVVQACAGTKRPGQRGTWITQEIQTAYAQLYGLGFAHSAEAWESGKLVGGLYGVSLGSAFFGESMFAHRPDASKSAFATLVEKLKAWHFTLVDCQVETEHLARFGAQPWPRRRFLAELEQALKAPTRRGPWTKEN